MTLFKVTFLVHKKAAQQTRGKYIYQGWKGSKHPMPATWTLPGQRAAKSRGSESRAAGHRCRRLLGWLWCQRHGTGLLVAEALGSPSAWDTCNWRTQASWKQEMVLPGGLASPVCDKIWLKVKLGWHRSNSWQNFTRKTPSCAESREMKKSQMHNGAGFRNHFGLFSLTSFWSSKLLSSLQWQ